MPGCEPGFASDRLAVGDPEFQERDRHRGRVVGGQLAVDHELRWETRQAQRIALAVGDSANAEERDAVLRRDGAAAAVSSSWASIVVVVWSGGCSSASRKLGSASDGVFAAKLAASAGVLPWRETRLATLDVAAFRQARDGMAAERVGAGAAAAYSHLGRVRRCTGVGASTPAQAHAASPTGVAR